MRTSLVSSHQASGSKTLHPGDFTPRDRLLKGPTLIGLTIQTAIGVVGVLLVIAGLRGRRLGREPRCARCSYDLTGLTSERCPECGVTVGPKTTRQGLWRRRYGFLLAGGCLLVLELASVAALFRSMDILARAPFSVVMLTARMGETEALHELLDRYSRHRLDEGELDDLADAALAAQTVSRSSVPQRIWGDLLQRLHDAGELSSEQRERLYERVVAGFEGETRSRVVPGELFPIALSMSSRNRVGNLRAVITDWRLMHHDRELARPSDPGPAPVPMQFTSWGPLLVPVTIDLEPGRYEVNLIASSALYPARFNIPDPLWTGDAVIPLDIEVFCPERGGDVELIDRPELRGSFRRALFRAGSYFNPGNFLAAPGRRYRGRAPGGMFPLRLFLNAPAPVDATFRVTLRALAANPTSDTPPDREVGYLICYGGSATAHTFLTGRLGEIEEHLDRSDMQLVFAAGPSVARRTLDMYETWNGTLIFAPPDAPIPFRPYPLSRR